MAKISLELDAARAMSDDAWLARVQAVSTLVQAMPAMLSAEWGEPVGR